MDYTKYVQYLKNKNIILFDHQYRLSFYKLNRLQHLNNQNGGGKYTTNYNLFKNKSNNDIINIINSSLSNNTKIGYLYYLIYN
jgi:hypothetical protein